MRHLSTFLIVASLFVASSAFGRSNMQRVADIIENCTVNPQFYLEISGKWLANKGILAIMLEGSEIYEAVGVKISDLRSVSLNRSGNVYFECDEGTACVGKMLGRNTSAGREPATRTIMQDTYEFSGCSASVRARIVDLF